MHSKTKTKNPGKQRKRQWTASLHDKQKMMRVHLSRDLRKELKGRAIGVRKNDKVKVMKGKFKGKDGKVERVDLKKLRVFIAGLQRKKVSGKEVPVPFRPTQLLLMELDRSDAERLR